MLNIPAPSQFRKKPVVVSASQWFMNGDHPLDYSKTHDGLENGELRQFSPEERRANGWEGDIVRYYRHPDDSGERACQLCGNTMHMHGWIDTKEGGHIVCPGDWIITGVQGEHYPCKPYIFAETYEPASPLSAASLAAWPVASAADMELARKAARIVLMSMDAAPGSTLDSVAAAIATMAPAYRAMLAAAPAPSAPGDAQDERDDLIERLLDAQQDVNQIANETMSQTLCSVSALLDEIEVALRRQVPGPAPAAGDALAWQGLTDAERDGYVGELVDYGTDFVAPLYSVVESIEKRLREKNAALAAQVPQQGEA